MLHCPVENNGPLVVPNQWLLVETVKHDSFCPCTTAVVVGQSVLTAFANLSLYHDV